MSTSHMEARTEAGLAVFCRQATCSQAPSIKPDILVESLRRSSRFAVRLRTQSSLASSGAYRSCPCLCSSTPIFHLVLT